jgi:hypothetical protein
MKPSLAFLLFFAVIAVAGTGAANFSLPDRNAPDTVLGTADSMWGFVEWLVQLGDDLMAFARDVLRYLEVGSEYIEGLAEAMETGRDLVNATVGQART